MTTFSASIEATTAASTTSTTYPVCSHVTNEEDGAPRQLQSSCSDDDGDDESIDSACTTQPSSSSSDVDDSDSAAMVSTNAPEFDATLSIELNSSGITTRNHKRKASFEDSTAITIRPKRARTISSCIKNKDSAFRTETVETTFVDVNGSIESVLSNPKAVNDCIATLFPDSNAVQLTCMSARMFAAFALYIRHDQTWEADDNNSTSDDEFSCAEFQGLRPYLTSLVNVECKSLDLVDDVHMKKRVQFSGFDDSSTKPPRDSVLGSHLDRHHTILAMEQVLQEVDDLLQNQDEDVLPSLESLRDFLTKVQSKDDGFGTMIRESCSKSMPAHWAPDRFLKAATFYCEDIEAIVTATNNDKDTVSLAESGVELNLERQLASSIGRTIRFHLRRFFNPIYGTVTEAPDVQEPHWKQQSKICDMVEMKHPDWYDPGSNSAAGDGSISTILSFAIETIFERLGADQFLDKDPPQRPLDGFCQHEATQRGIFPFVELLSSRRATAEGDGDVGFTQEEEEAIFRDAFEAQDYLSTSKAIRFIHELIQWPGVNDEIQRLGGWSLVEQYATIMMTHKLDRIRPSDCAHFIMLSDIDAFFKRVQLYWNHTNDGIEDVTNELDELWARFNCETENQKRLERFPLIARLKQLLFDGLRFHMFPYLEKPTEYIEEVAEQHTVLMTEEDDDDYEEEEAQTFGIAPVAPMASLSDDEEPTASGEGEIIPSP